MSERHLQVVESDSEPAPDLATVAATDIQYYNEQGFPFLQYSQQLLQANPTLDEPVDELIQTFERDSVVSVHLAIGDIASRVYAHSDKLDAVDISLDPPLIPGHMRQLETIYLFGDMDHHPTSFSRLIGDAVMKYLHLSIVFPGARVPAKLWETEWEGPESEGQIVYQEEIEIPKYFRPKRFIADLEMHNLSPGKVVGFSWRWPSNKPPGDGGEPKLVPRDTGATLLAA